MARDTASGTGSDDSRPSPEDFGIEPTDPATLGGGNDGDGNGGPGDGGDDFDPAIHIGRDRLNRDGSFRRKRVRGGGGSSGGSRAGSGSGNRSRASARLDITGVQAVIFSVHAAIAGATSNPIWEISDGESKSLAVAILEIEKQYPTKIDPRALAWMNLAGVLGAVYGTRLFAMRMEASARKRGASPPPAGVTAQPYQHQSAPPPGPGIHPADVIHPNGAVNPEGTTYRPMPEGVIDEGLLAEAMRTTGR